MPVAESHPTAAKLGYTTTLERGSGGTTPTWSLGELELTDLTPFDGSRDQVEVTNHRSPDFSVERIPGLIDWGTCSWEANLDVDNAYLDQLLTDFKSAGNAPWRITFPSGRSMTFSASLTSLNITSPVKDVMKVSGELSISGPPSFSAVVPPGPGTPESGFEPDGVEQAA